MFFPDETTAITAGYRPCAVCLPATYARWKQNRESASAMDTIEERKQDRSPLIPASDLAEYGDLPLPSPHTEAELTALIGLLKYPGTVSVGHSRDDASRAAAEAFSTVWQAGGGTVLAMVDWPESAASWLRPATRLTSETPDAWVVAAAPLGFAQLARRLRRSTDWALTVRLPSPHSRMPACSRSPEKTSWTACAARAPTAARGTYAAAG